MPVTSLTYQPATGQLIAAYRPIVFKTQATATGGGALPPYVVCDVYINNLYYKSIIRTSPESTTSTYSIFQFDISDALQEYLQPDIAQIDNSNILPATHMSAKVFCRFRSSDKDSDGFTVEEGTKPVQGTKNTSPVAGTGTQSNTFFVINAVLQHEDNQNLALHLYSFKQGIWAANAYPLTHRNRYYYCDGDSDHFPMIYTGDCIAADLILHYRLKGQTSFQQATSLDINVCAGISFTPSVSGNRVDVHLASAPPTGQTVFGQYKKQADSTWIDAGVFTTQDFFFYVNGDNIAGDYDIRVIHFCTPCLSSAPELGTFTLTGASVNLAWRGIDPFCVQQTFGSPIYVKVEVRNVTSDTVDYPNNIDPLERTVTQAGDLYAMFFSDYFLLNPLTVTQDGMKIFIFRDQFNSFVGAASFQNQQQTVSTYIVDVAGTEVFLSNNISTQIDHYSYNPFPAVDGTTNTRHQYYPYPTRLLVGGATGEKGYTNLQQYNTTTNVPTGNSKPNDSGDPDYIAPAPDTITCPNGPDITSVTFGYGLNIFNVMIRQVITQFQIPLEYNTGIYDNTYSGGYSLVYALPKNMLLHINVFAKTLDPGNTTGVIKCRVTYIDDNGVSQVATFDVQNNIYTPLGQVFHNIVNINISNY
jgi:hypothetical protein